MVYRIIKKDIIKRNLTSKMIVARIKSIQLPLKKRITVIILKSVSSRAEGASATETVNLGSIPGWVKPKTSILPS